MATFDRIAPAAVRQCAPARTLALAAAVVLVLAGCSDDDTATPPSATADRSTATIITSGPSTSSPTTITTMLTTTTSSTSTPTSAGNGQSVEEEIVARYVGYWNARFAANSGTPNPDDPALREFATGAQLDAVIAETQSNLDQGLAFRPAANPAGIQRVNVVEVEGDHAVVQECVVTDGVIYRRHTGEIIDDNVYTQNVRGELTRVDGVWRVSAARLVQQWDGVAGCALAS